MHKPKLIYLPSATRLLINLFNGEVIAGTIRPTQDTLQQLPNLPECCILHSDQGSVYTLYTYQHTIKEKRITMSMSRKGTPADNSRIETFYLDRFYQTTNAHVI